MVGRPPAPPSAPAGGGAARPGVTSASGGGSSVATAAGAMTSCRPSARQALLDLAVQLDIEGMPLAAMHALRLAGRMASN